MRLAILADIHANLPALEAVLRDVAGRGVEGVLHLGDLVGYGPHPDAVVARVREQQIGGVVGNYDLAVCHPDGYVEIRDRLKDIIISGGENISSLELESVLFRHPKILEAAVVAKH